LDYKKVLEIDPKNCPVQILYTIYLVYHKKYEKAKVYVEKIEDNCAHITAMTDVIKCIKHVVNGEREKALAIENPEKHFLLEMPEEALNILNNSYEEYNNREQSRYLHYLYNPKYNFLRADPRFQEILAKHKKLYDENLKKYGEGQL
jgi:hypothetical protein